MGAAIKSLLVLDGHCQMRHFKTIYHFMQFHIKKLGRFVFLDLGTFTANMMDLGTFTANVMDLSTFIANMMNLSTFSIIKWTLLFFPT